MYSHHRFDTRARERFAVVQYIEIYYNRKRLHSSLGYRTPFEALTDYQRDPAAA
ncbi:MAG TPA: IS3 family transposase [Pseudonocardiaceae bacterium]|jgi:putative transposase|nr:IS3 family transposase [Pseudonocardiaceae bacterium]